MIPVALTVAGSDCTGGAGIQADLKTFAALGVYGESVITSVVAENTCRVFSRQDISPEMVTAQLDAVYQDIPPHAVKLGMLPTIQVVEAVADWLAAHPKQPVVTDPVLVATSGDDLVDRKALETIQTKLLPLTTVLTPNLPEAEALTGIAVTDEVSMKAAAAMLCNMGAKAVLVKGGAPAGGSPGHPLRRQGILPLFHPPDPHPLHPRHRLHPVQRHCRLSGLGETFGGSGAAGQGVPSGGHPSRHAFGPRPWPHPPYAPVLSLGRPMKVKYKGDTL